MAGTTSYASLQVTMDGTGLQDGLEGWQKGLGLVKDEMGMLYNAQGKWVDGLSRSQIKLGVHRDALDQLRNKNDQIVEGLKNWEIERGRWVGSMGNVYDAQGKLIRQGEEYISMLRKTAAEEDAVIREAKRLAIEQEAEARRREDMMIAAHERVAERQMLAELERAEQAERLRLKEAVEQEAAFQRMLKQEEQARKQIGSSIRSMGMPILQLSTQLAVLGGAESNVLSKTTAVTGAFLSGLGAAEQFTSGMKALRTATQAQTTAQLLLNAASGNWVGLLAGGAAAGGALYMMSQIGNDAEESTPKIESMTEALREMLKVAREAGRSEWNMNDYWAVAGMSASEGARDSLEKELERIDEQNRLLKEQARLEDEINEKRKQRPIFVPDQVPEFNDKQTPFERLGLDFDWGGKFIRSIWGDFDVEKKNEELNEVEKQLENIKNKLDPNILGDFVFKINESFDNEGLTEAEKKVKSLMKDMDRLFEVRKKALENRGSYGGQTIDAIDQAISATEIRIERTLKALMDSTRKALGTSESILLKSLDPMEQASRDLKKKLDEINHALGDPNLTEDDEKKLTDAKNNLKESLDGLARTYSVEGKLEKEIADARKKQKEQLERIDLLRKQVKGDDDIIREFLGKERGSILGSFSKYFDEAGKNMLDSSDEFRKQAEDLARRGRLSMMSQDEIEMALYRLRDEFLKDELKPEKSTLRLGGGSGSATFGSVEAYKIVNAGQDKTVTAIDRGTNVIKDKLTTIAQEVVGTQKAIRDNQPETTL